jgi:hypothetical protein
MKNPSRAWRRAAATGLAALALVAGCGGDEQIARTGGGGTGLGAAIGTVTGFGSVVVDGEPWDDRRAAVEIERSPGLGVVAAETRLGQRIAVAYGIRGTADRITVEPDVVGRVSEIDATAVPAQFKVAGQTVRLNGDPTAGPVTVFEGVAGLAALRVDDFVEVHGSLRFDAALGRQVLIASRIERLTALPAGLVRVSGIVEANNAAARSFRLGELTVTTSASTIVVPASRVLADGQRVTVWSAAAVVAGSGGPTLAADFVRIVERSAGGRSELSGVVSRFDATALTFELAGVRVNARAALVVPASQSLAEGRYVIASGSFDTAGVLQATQVRIRQAGAADAAVELSGTITNFVSAADFRVRGVAVDASGLAALPGCPSTGLANGLYVEIEGRIGPSGDRVVASSLRCTAAAPGGIVTLEGVAGNVDVAARRFTLTPAAGTPRTVQWTATTLFAGLAPESLAGRGVAVDGYEDAAGFIATKLRPRN